MAGCGGSSSGSSASAPLQEGSFCAVDFTGNSCYVVNSGKAGEGSNCHIYLENGQPLSQAQVNGIIAQFDTVIRPGENAAFGTEPNRGIDGDPKIYILLLNIKYGFVPGTSTSFIAGYVDPTSEYTLSPPLSNQKEILFLNINQAIGKGEDHGKNARVSGGNDASAAFFQPGVRTGKPARQGNPDRDNPSRRKRTVRASGPYPRTASGKNGRKPGISPGWSLRKEIAEELPDERSDTGRDDLCFPFARIWTVLQTNQDTGPPEERE